MFYDLAPPHRHRGQYDAGAPVWWLVGHSQRFAARKSFFINSIRRATAQSRWSLATVGLPAKTTRITRRAVMRIEWRQFLPEGLACGETPSPFVVTRFIGSWAAGTA